MFNGAVEFVSIEELKKYCEDKKLQFIEKDGIEIKGSIVNENNAEVGYVCFTPSSSFKNLKPDTKCIIVWT